MADTIEPGLDTLSVKEGSKSKPVVANENVLSQMQDLYKQKLAEKNYWLQDLADASAWWSGGAAGPVEGLSKRAAVRSAQEKDLQSLQAGLAGQQNAIQNRDLFFGKAPTAAPSMGATTAPSMGATTAPTTAPAGVNASTGKAGAQELNQRTSGLLGLVKDPSLQMAIGAEYLRDPDKGTTALVTHLANEAKTPDKLKELKALLSSGVLKPGSEGAAIVISILGASAFNPTDTLTGAGFTTKTTPFNVAGNFTAGGTGVPTGAPMQPAPKPMGAPTQPAPAMGAPTQPAPVQPAPTVSGGAPMQTAPTVSGGAPMQTAPTVSGVTKPTMAPTMAPTTTPIAGGGVNPAQAQVLGGLIPPGTKEAGEAIKQQVLTNIDVAANRPKAAGTEAGKAEGLRQAALENVRADINNKKGQATTLLNILDETPEAVGLAYRGKAMGYLLKGAEAGIIPGIGGKKDLEEVAAVSLSPKARQNRAKFDSVATNIASEVRRDMAKGTGAVSNYETTQFEKAAGLTTKNPAETNKYFAIFFAETIRAKEQQLKEWDKFVKQNPKAEFSDFERSDAYKEVSNKWNERLQKHFPELKGKDLAFGNQEVSSNTGEEEGWRQRYGKKK
jgi:hypothetical protein